MPAEGTSNLWNLPLGAGHGLTSRAGDQSTAFTTMSFHSGGAGARPHQDGLSATPYPSGVRNVPVEITEAITPLVIWRKDYRADSGGPGKQRGGLGQVMEISSRENAPFGLFARYERVHYPPRGRDGGGNGANGRLTLNSGEVFRNKGFQVVPKGKRLLIEMPGGGGYGDPFTRQPEAVAADVKAGLVSLEAAARDYGVSVLTDFSVDAAETARLRGD